MSSVFIFAVALPAVMALSTLTGPGQRAAIRGAWLAPLPALALALWPVPAAPLPLEWLLLGGRVGLDSIGRVFLIFTAVLWSAAGAYARHYTAGDDRQARYFAFHLLTLSGNIGLIVAQDLASFYAAFAIMTFAGYGLVVHTATPEARRAGRIYLVMSVLGEAMLVVAFITAALGASSLGLSDVALAVAESPHRNLIIGLLLGGFGIKAGALPLHVWLPLAHPVAPTPASAVLSGSMIKAGLLGWLRFLPLGIMSLEGWGATLVTAGLIAAFFGVAVGVTQRDAKTALAYSSISQMGLINVTVGIGLASPDGWPLALTACLAYVVHHGVAKGALFLGVGVMAEARSLAQRRLAMGGMLFAALALAGAPFTSGGIAKQYLKDIVPLSPVRWPIELDVLLGLSALGTTLLMARVLLLVAAYVPAFVARDALPLWRSWAITLVAVATVVWVVPSHYDVETYPPTVPTAEAVWVAIWPVMGGAVLAWVTLLLFRRGRFDPRRVHVQPGDLLVPLERLLALARARLARPRIPETRPVVSLGSKWYGVYAADESVGLPQAMELRLSRWRTVGLLFLLLIIAIAGMVAIGTR